MYMYMLQSMPCLTGMNPAVSGVTAHHGAVTGIVVKHLLTHRTEIAFTIYLPDLRCIQGRGDDLNGTQKCAMPASP